MKVTSAMLKQIATMPAEAMGVTLLFLAGQLEQHERKQVAAAERQSRKRERDNARDKQGEVTLLSQQSNAAVTALAPVVDNLPKPSLLVEESKKEEKGNLSVSQKGPTSKPFSTDPEGFAEFWAAYPKRLGNADRKAAVKGFRAASKRVDFKTIIAGAQAYASHCDDTGKSGTEFVRQARTWLNAEGWNERYEPAQHRPKPGSIAAGFTVIDAALAAEERAIREEEERQQLGETDADDLPRLRQVN